MILYAQIDFFKLIEKFWLPAYPDDQESDFSDKK